MQGTDGGEKYILVGEKDTERGFTVVEYDTVNAAPAMFEDTRNLVRPSRIIYLRKASVDCPQLPLFLAESLSPDLSPFVVSHAE
jgi:hypothetical protein